MVTDGVNLPAVDELAQIIRRVDGNHSLGAGELAEAILAALSPPVPVDRSLVERLREGPIRTGDTEDGEYELFDVEEAAQTMHEAADRISSLERELEEALRYATHLLTSYVNQYCDPVPEWAPLPDLIGVLTQIDNASTVTADILAQSQAAEARISSLERELEEARVDTRRIADKYDVAHPSPAPSASMGRVTVKALQWEAYGGRWRASSPGITVLKYIVNPDKGGDFYVSVNGQPLTGKYPSSDGAKAAAQSHFAAAIFAALDSPPIKAGEAVPARSALQSEKDREGGK